MSKTKTIAEGAAPKATKKKAVKKVAAKVETAVENVVAEVAKVDDFIIAEANEVVATPSITRWHVLAAAVLLTIGTLVIVL